MGLVVRGSGVFLCLAWRLIGVDYCLLLCCLFALVGV